MTDRSIRRRVTFQHAIEYEVATSAGIFRPDNPDLLSAGRRENSRRFVVVDANIEQEFGAQIRGYFAANGIESRIVLFPGGEAHKTVESFLEIAAELDAFPIDRRDEPIIAVGGGVLTDVVGFVAASYRRGIPYIKVPTTLMGYVDASVGIKTGINFNGNKNRLGAFAPPQKVLLDRTLLRTLPRRHILNGVGEILKMAVICSSDLFALLEAHGLSCIESNFQGDAGDSILNFSIHSMLDELQTNLYEDELARRVDFGHTFAYGLETRHGANLLHGEAVLLDIAISCSIANARKILSGGDLDRILRLIRSLSLPLRTELLDVELLWQSLEERTRHRNGAQRVPLPRALGECVFVNDITKHEVRAATESLRPTVTRSQRG